MEIAETVNGSYWSASLYYKALLDSPAVEAPGRSHDKNEALRLTVSGYLEDVQPSSNQSNKTVPVLLRKADPPQQFGKAWIRA